MGTHFQVFSLILLALIACRNENDAPKTYYPHANQLDTIIHDGITRTFLLHVPPDYSKDNATPLVIMLHGYTGTSIGHENYTHFSENADVEGFIVAYPDGLKYPWNETYPQAWNAGGIYEEWTGGTDDVGFIKNMIELISRYYQIDQSRIFVTGHSNGAFMCYRLAYELSCKIAAIAPLSGQMINVPSQPPGCDVAIMHLHALNDEAVPYYGKESNELAYEAVDTVLSKWASWYTCDSEPDTVYQNSDYLVKSWNCTGYATVSSYVLNNGGHNWFTSANSGVQANDVICNFFKTHPKTLKK